MSFEFFAVRVEKGKNMILCLKIARLSSNQKGICGSVELLLTGLKKFALIIFGLVFFIILCIFFLLMLLVSNFVVIVDRGGCGVFFCL